MTRGEIYNADLDPVIGSEQGGKRPIVVLQNNVGNKYSPTVIVAAITSKVKKQMPTHVVLTSDCLIGGSIALLEQLRTIDKLRLGEYIGKLGKEDMRRVEEALLISLGVEKDGDIVALFAILNESYCVNVSNYAFAMPYSPRVRENSDPAADF